MSAGITASISTTFKIGGQSFTIPTATLTKDSIAGYSGTIDAGTTNFHRDFHAKVAQVCFVGMKATKAVTIKINSSSAPDQTFTLPDDSGTCWMRGSPTSNPVLEDVTDIYITNAGSSASEVTFYALVDQPGVGS